MTWQNTSVRLAGITISLVLLLPGCRTWKQYYAPPTPRPMGALSDPVWQNQEANAEQADFIVYQHEFAPDTEWLNTAGEDHVKKIASRLLAGQEAQVLVERSNMSVRPETTYQYPIHPNPELDMRRREIIVRCLSAMGVADADERVVVAPAFVQGFTGNEAEAAYQRGLGSFDHQNAGYGSFGGFMFRGGY
jgi:hypothetical protein